MTVTILCKYRNGSYVARCSDLKVSASSTGEPPERCAVMRCAVAARAKSLGLPKNPEHLPAVIDGIKITCVATYNVTDGTYLAQWPDPRDQPDPSATPESCN